MVDVIVLDGEGREILKALTVIIRDHETKMPLLLAKSSSDGLLVHTADEPQFADILKASVFPSDLAADEIRTPTDVRRF